LRWTDRDYESRIPAAVVGRDSDEAAISAVLARDHVQWIDVNEAEQRLNDWIPLSLEVHDLRMFRHQHEALATQLHEARARLFHGEIEHYTPPEGPPCGPALPTNIEEIQPLRDARAQFERGLIRAAIREKGSLKDAAAALGISYTSLWRRLR
jgi:DNA-binding NtrC family response regulator